MSHSNSKSTERKIDGIREQNRTYLADANARLKKIETMLETAKAKKPTFSDLKILNNSQIKILIDAQEVLEKESKLRIDIENAYAWSLSDETKKKALLALDAHRKGSYAKMYPNGSRVADPCVPCIEKQLVKLDRAEKQVYQPENFEKMAYAITSAFEASQARPDYCAIADNFTDAGGLSFGKHQAAEKPGVLKKLLDQYVIQTDPAPEKNLKSNLDFHLSKFSTDGKKYEGAPADRLAFKKLLSQELCRDPAMEKAQDAFFRTNYFTPSQAKAERYGVESSLGKAMFYDMEVQGSGASTEFCNEALARWARENGFKKVPSACRPKDPSGPSERDFLILVNDQRRKRMKASTTLYNATQHRPNEFDRLIKEDNMDLKNDIYTRGVRIKGLK